MTSGNTDVVEWCKSVNSSVKWGKGRQSKEIKLAEKLHSKNKSQFGGPKVNNH